MAETPCPALYLLRFDDLCPTQDRRRWERVLPLLEAFQLRPILGVVPENRDPELARSAADPGFWAQMRALQGQGATIGLHGYDHLCVQRGRPMLALQPHSEFAGAPLDEQQRRIHAGVESLRGRGLKPRIWVAPRHGFDRNTLTALRREGIALLSDGLARRPLRRGGLTWLPMQLWAPVVKSCGLWTICLHSNSASDSLVEQLLAFLQSHGDRFRSVDEALEVFPPGPARPLDWIHEQSALVRLRVRRRLAKIYSARAEGLT